MSVTALNPDQPQVEIIDGRLHVHSLILDGTIVELVEEMDIASRPDELFRLLRQVAETGSIVVAHGHRRAAVDAIAAEIERLISSTAEETVKLPALIQTQLNEHLTKLAAALDTRFDGGRTSSVQHQLRDLVKGATSDQVRTLLQELFGEGGPLAGANKDIANQLRLVNSHSTEVVAKVTSLIERLEQKEKLADQHERTTHKGAPFEDQVEVELVAIHGRLGDDVSCVKHETGIVPGSEAGDFLVTIDTSQTGGREARVVVECKTGKLSGPKAHATLKEAMENRGAHAGILVFDGVADAPLRGRHYMAYPDGKIVVVLDEEHGVLGFEVACIQARLVALAAVAANGKVDAKWLVTQCDQLTELIEKAGAIKRGSSAARRGLDTVDSAYSNLRDEAIQLLEQIKAKLAD
jgi:hypothetical protein